MEKLHTAADLLLDIEAEMRRLSLWEKTPPPPEDLASRLPFCCDTLAFPQWLQFVFLVRVTALIEARRPLPSQCGVAPMAEEWFMAHGEGSPRLIRLLREFDDLLSDTP
ncbi:MAG: YqcC family protein [Methylothermaceae bacterium]|nr:YqcC family protein [Methylothermaceae bacterium]